MDADGGGRTGLAAGVWRWAKQMSGFAPAPCDRGVIEGARTAAKGTPQRGAFVLGTTILGSSMAFVDNTVVNVALPALQASLNANITEIQWVVEAYTLLLAALLLTGGALGDRFGRRRLFGLGVVLFAAASAGCALSPNVNVLIAARAVQGIGGALLVPASLAIISAAFEGPARGHAIGLWSGFSAITAGLGLLVGGVLIDTLSWRWIFLINVPIALITLWLTWRYVKETRDPSAARLDWIGAGLATLALAGLTFGLIEASERGFTAPYVGLSLVAGILLGGAFIGFEGRTSQLMMPLALYRSANFAGANLITLLLYAALGGGLFFLPLNLIQVQGFSATQAGAATLPFVLLMFALSRWSGGLVGRFGARRPLIFGPLMAALGFVLLALPDAKVSYWLGFFPGIVTLGLGMALSVAPLTTTVMNAVTPDHAGLASGVNNAVARAAGLIAIAALGPVMVVVFKAAALPDLARLALPPSLMQPLHASLIELGGLQLPPELCGPVREAVEGVIAQSFITGFKAVTLICAALAVAASWVAWRFIDRQVEPESIRAPAADTGVPS